MLKWPASVSDPKLQVMVSPASASMAVKVCSVPVVFSATGMVNGSSPPITGALLAPVTATDTAALTPV